jgi:hypothetical protein
MTQFTPIVPGRLWQVSDLLPATQADEICATDWCAVTRESSSGQESWPRQQVTWSDPTAVRYSGYINRCLPEINRALGTEFQQSRGHFWIDLPGFTCLMHTDGHLPTAMQLYWTVPGPEWGTGFYHYKTLESLLYQFESRPNSGYIMLNHADPDGSQPLQWHAMLNPVPAGHIRVSSYWYFS